MAGHSVEFLRQVVDYNPESGVLTWRERGPEFFSGQSLIASRRWNKRYAGQVVGREMNTGYLQTSICLQRFMVHRLAWIVFHGENIPECAMIDHVDGDKANNRINNLRICTPTQNVQNRAFSKSGYRGAFFHKSTGKWQASIRFHLGTFDTKEQASAAYEAMAKKIHSEFYLENGRRVTASSSLKNV